MQPHFVRPAPPATGKGKAARTAAIDTSPEPLGCVNADTCALLPWGTDSRRGTMARACTEGIASVASFQSKHARCRRLTATLQDNLERPAASHEIKGTGYYSVPMLMGGSNAISAPKLPALAADSGGAQRKHPTLFARAFLANNLPCSRHCLPWWHSEIKLSAKRQAPATFICTLSSAKPNSAITSRQGIKPAG